MTTSSVTIPEKPHRRIYEQSYIRSLFDSIAHRYDFLNHALSFGIDYFWRRKAIRLLQPVRPKHILDVATGTADLAIEASHLHPERIIGIDISSKMLEIGRSKVASRKLENIITLESGTAERLRFEPCSFDIVMAAFGVRNFENLELGISEFYRVLRDGGAALILEFSKPRSFLIKQMYQSYSKYFLPLFGGLIAKNRMAYKYLPSTVAEFPDGENFCEILRSVGFTSITRHPQTFGIVTIYIAKKPNTQ